MDTFSFCFDVNSVCIIYATSIYTFVNNVYIQTPLFVCVCAIFIRVDTTKLVFFLSEFQLRDFKYSYAIAALV